MSGLSEKAARGNSGPGLSVEVKDNIRTIKFNRPEKRNAITPEMYDAIRVALTEANTDDATKIIVMTGTGEYFCSGNDLGNFTISKDIKALAEEGRTRFHAFTASYIECQKPIVVLANGPAIGIGVTIFGLADIVYASERAYFSAPFTSLGQSPEACSSYTFPRIMGNAKASELLLFNAKMTAKQAEAAGLVSAVFPHEAFEAETTKRVQAMAQLPLKSLVYTKELIRGRERELLHEINTAECDRITERVQSEDCKNAIMKFFSKKK
jgi:peroxisomal 3,2-trans-enoyl-CoA isomerase